MSKNIPITVHSDIERHEDICRAICVKWETLSAVGFGNFLSGLIVGLQTQPCLLNEMQLLVAINNAHIMDEIAEFAREYDGGEA